MSETEQSQDTATRTGTHASGDVRHFQKTYRVGVDATPETLNLDTRVEAFVQELVQRGLRPVSDVRLDELSEPVMHHTEGRLPESRPGTTARFVDRRPPTGYRWATLGVDAVPAWAYDYGAAADAHTAAERAAEIEQRDETVRGYDADLPSETPTYDATAHDHLEGLIAADDTGESAGTE